MKIPREVFSQLEGQFKSISQRYKIPGVGMSIVVGNENVYSIAWGYRNKEKEFKCTPNTTFAIGSTSKSFAALAIMQIVEKGLIKLEDPIDKYLPVKWAKKYGEDNPITIHHLLSQTSGISDLGLSRVLLAEQLYNETQFKKYDLTTDESYLNHINGAWEYINPPGRYSYCNTNFTLAHMIVEKVTGKSYADYLEENLFVRCEMEKSTLKNHVYQSYEDRMTGYFIHHDGDELITKPIDYLNYQTIWGCGGVYSSVNDLAKYLRVFLNEGKYKDTQILNKGSLQKLFKVHSKCQELEDFGVKGIGSETNDAGYGYGWFVINDFFGHKVVLHPGSVVVSSSILVLMPELKIGIALAWNGLEEVFSEFLVTIFGAFATLFGKNPEKEFGIFHEEIRLNKLCGTYSDYVRGNPLEITRQGADLYIEWIGNQYIQRPKQPLHPMDKEGGCMKYYTKNSSTGYDLAEFIFEENGRVRLLIEKHTMFKEDNE